MGRKRSKKKSASAAGEGAAKPAGNKDQQQVVPRTYLKIKATFMCSNIMCKKLWTSVHAWERDEDIFCDFCASSKADVVKFKDEICELANYRCVCEEHWQSLVSGEAEECYECRRMVLPDGSTQERFGRHFWFVCPACKLEWEDFSLTEQRTQRCGKCPQNARGDIISITKVKPKPFWKIQQEKEKGIGGGGKHNSMNCDMCQDLKRRGMPGCLNYRKVQCQARKLASGAYAETITAASR